MLAALSARRVLPAKSVLASSLHSARRRATGAVTRNYTAMASSTAPSWSDWRLNPPCAISSTSQTLAHHDQLPRLPVPDIQATREKILNSAKPLAKDEKEFEEMKRQLDQFLSSPLAKELNDALVARSKDPKHPSWLAEWWDTQAYMAYRDSVVINVSYYYAFHKLPQSLRKSGSTTSISPHDEPSNPAFVAASLVTTILDFRALLLQGKIEPDMMGGTKLDMESYKWMFNACRIPAKPADYAIKLKEDAPESAHFIVIRNNQFYKLPLWDQQTGEKYSLETLQKTFQHIYDSASGSADPVGLLTGGNRDVWTDARAHLLDISEDNIKTLSMIEAASFVVCLDPATPSSKVSPDPKADNPGVVEFSRQLLHGNGENRWFDKPLQWVVFDSGETGFIGEHSCMDGTPTAKVNDYIGARLSKGDMDVQGSTSSIPVEGLAIKVDDKTRQTIEETKKAYMQVVEEEDMGFLYYTRYGKNGIKTAKSSPDGWVQMVMQLAYGLTYPEAPVTGTYEAAQTRKYALGRTETVRVCSPASKAFVLSMLPNSKKTDQERRALFLDALKQHGKDMKDASIAHGCDRHIFGLKMILSESGKKDKVEVFDNQLFKNAGNWKLSTSAIISKYFVGYGWGQVDPQGFGLPYSIHDNHLVFTVTSKTTQKNAEFTKNLRKAADMLMDMSESALKSEGEQSLKAKL